MKQGETMKDGRSQLLSFITSNTPRSKIKKFKKANGIKEDRNSTREKSGKETLLRNTGANLEERWGEKGTN